MAEFCRQDAKATDVPSLLSGGGEAANIDFACCIKPSSTESDALYRKENIGHEFSCKSGSCCPEEVCESVGHDQAVPKANDDLDLEQSSEKKKKRRGRRGKRKNKADVSKTDENCTISKSDDASLSITETNKETNLLVETSAISDLTMSEIKEKDKNFKSEKRNVHHANSKFDHVSSDLQSSSNTNVDSSHRTKNKPKKKRWKKEKTDPNYKSAEVDDKSDSQRADQIRRPKSGKNKCQTDPFPSTPCEAFPSGMVPTRNPLTPPKPKQSPSSGSRRKEKTPRKADGHGTPTPGKSSPKSARKKYRPYEDYWTQDLVSAALKRGQLVKGAIRISQRNYELAWVSVPGIERDIVVDGMIARNRALHGDIVALQILPRSEWKVNQEQYDETLLQEEIARNKKILQNKLKEDIAASSPLPHLSEEEPTLTHTAETLTTVKPHFLSDMKEIPDQFLQQTAKVVYIVEKKHTRVASGHLKPFIKKTDESDALFTPTDSCLPRIRIPHNCCPAGFFDRPNDFANTLFIARITSWPSTAPLDSFLANGTIARSLGEAGEIEPETEAILMEYAIDTGPFPDEVTACLPQMNPWKIPDSELAIRRDFRDECVFTIDPMTARDLDDALHCKKLSDGTYEVGVHIADVSFFVRPDTALDNIALQRGTSTYMVQKVIPMLPHRLCEELCSLNPGEDRLCMSVVWKMTSKGEIVDEWKGRGVIRSRVKMAYEHAQEMIENPSKKWSPNELPPISDGVDIDEISSNVNVLHQMAVYMRRRRVENGALRLDQVKLRFDLDKDSGLPNGYHIHQQRDSNKLVEEFMLLANMAVARHIYNAFPITAILRRHPQPHQKQLNDLIELCKSLGVSFSCNSSKAIQQSLAQFKALSPEHEILVHLTMKPMKTAEYFCAGCVDDTAYGHYALSVPLYTHFTSPIRRYPDILVHRMLAASLAIDEQVEKTSEDLDIIATHCNDRRHAAKTCSELSSEMFFGIFVRECGPLEEDGIVAGVMDQSFDVLVPKLGVTKRIYAKFCPGVKKYEFVKPAKNNPAQMLLTWSVECSKSKEPLESVQRLRIFTRVRVQLTSESESESTVKPFRVFAKLVPPCVASDNSQEFPIDEVNNTMKTDSSFPLLPTESAECPDIHRSLLNPEDADLSARMKKQLFVSEDASAKRDTDKKQVDLISAAVYDDHNDDVIIEADSDEETK